MSPNPAMAAPSFPKPRGTVRAVLIAVLAVWVIFAVAVNWLGTGGGIYELLLLDRDRALHGEVWRFVTAPMMHFVQGHAGVSHVITTLLLLYFFGTSLEAKWGAKRMAVFLASAALFGEALQIGLDLAIPSSLGAALHQPVLFGGAAMGVACTIAWAYSNREQRVALAFVLPVSAMAMVWFTVGFYVLSLIAIGAPTEGMFAPFGGMLIGYALGGSTPSPLRKALLRRKLRALETAASRKAPGGKRGGPDLRVIRGDLDDDDKPRDKRFLN